MQYSRILLFICIAGLSLVTGQAQAAEEDQFLGKILSPSGQTVGSGRSALWTLPLVATQYQPSHPTPAMQSALQAQNEGRFLDALILLEDASKSSAGSVDIAAEISLLRASFLLQGNQSRQALAILVPLHANAQHAADAYALTAMAYLQLGQTSEASDAAQHAQDSGGGMLPLLAQSYALQARGHLAEARDVMRDFNGRTPQSAIALAREAELALTLGQAHGARMLVDQALAAEPGQPYVISVSGLVYLIDGNARGAKSAFEFALKRDPKDARALLGLGLAEIKLGDFQAGQAKLQEANEADPGNALILTYLGRSQQQLGQTEGARASWRSAQLADPKDPVPWLYQAQMELQTNRPQEARESLREAQARIAYRSVYRGELLLKEDEQLLQANQAEAERQLGLESLALHELSDPVGEKNSANLRGQAEILQDQRFGESARRSLLLQSMFNDRPGALPSELDVYGDGAGQTGAIVPQHGAISELGAQQTSYNNYDELFTPHTALAADASASGNNSKGAQVRLGLGGDTLGASVALRKYQTDGYAPYTNLDNRIGQGVLQWRPDEANQAFVSYQTFKSLHGEMHCPSDPYSCGVNHQIEDNSSATRLGLRHSLDDFSELRALVSRQQTRQTDNWTWATDFLTSDFVTNTLLLPYQTQGSTYGTDYNSSIAHSAELQYRRSGASYAMQWGLSSARSQLDQPANGVEVTNVAQQIYANWQQALSPRWQLETGLTWGKFYRLWNTSKLDTYLWKWLPRLGLVYSPDGATHVRLAAWRNLDNGAVGNASLAPPTLAGIVLDRPSDYRKAGRGIALGADRQLNAAWFVEGRAQQHLTDDPYIAGVVQRMSPVRVGESRLALHWQPGPLNVTLAYDDERFQGDPGIPAANSVLSQHLRSQQIGLRWRATSQWTANLAWSRNWLAATQQSTDINTNPILLDIQERFNQTDASLNWQFHRMGSVDMGVRNAGGRTSSYTEIDPLVPRFSKARFGYVRLRFRW